MAAGRFRGGDVLVYEKYFKVPMKTILSVLLAAAMAVLGTATARAENPDVPKTDQEARQQFQAADAELNQVYRHAGEAAAVVQSQAHLRKAQELWIQYRDENAAAYQTSESSRAVIKDRYYYYAATAITRSRIQELKILFPGG